MFYILNEPVDKKCTPHRWVSGNIKSWEKEIREGNNDDLNK